MVGQHDDAAIVLWCCCFVFTLALTINVVALTRYMYRRFVHEEFFSNAQTDCLRYCYALISWIYGTCLIVSYDPWHARSTDANLEICKIHARFFFSFAFGETFFLTI